VDDLAEITIILGVCETRSFSCVLFVLVVILSTNLTVYCNALRMQRAIEILQAQAVER